MPDRPNLVYEYDSTFEGLLCCVFESFDKKEIPSGIRSLDDPQGTLYLDTGAADAVRNHGKSLLPGGITEVHGSFEAGALVRLVYDRETVGVGLSNYNAADLLRIRGLKRHEVAAILGDAHYPEVVHRDNLLLDAAL